MIQSARLQIRMISFLADRACRLQRMFYLRTDIWRLLARSWSRLHWRVCARVISEVTQVDEISLVQHPKDKRRRVLFVSDEEGVRRNFLTWRSTDPGGLEGA
jgi:hypothetical protein